MRLRNACLPLAALCLFLATPALSQQSLGDLVAEGGFDWIIGKWAATTDDGQSIQLTYQWQLEKHAIAGYFKMGSYETRNIIYYMPSEDKVVQVGVDNQGGSSKAVWEPSGDKAVCKTEGLAADGQVNKMGVVYSKIDAKTMKVEVCEMDSSGQLGAYPWATLEMKRKD